MLLTIRIRKHERGLRFGRGDFAGVLQPGTYRLWRRLLGPSRDRVQIVSLLDTKLEHELLEVIVRHPSAADQLEVVDLTATQRALVWIDGRLEHILRPGLHAFWREPREVRIEIFDLDAVRFTHPKLQAVLGHADAAGQDRKSTRLNSSHVKISYAVFCLKKKKI